MIRVSEYIANMLADFGVRHVFMLTGGGAMFLNHAIGTHPRLKIIFNQHEQACAMAAEGYARIANLPGVINVTTGPGGINAMNGVYGAWTDSIPMLVISGQVKRETCLGMYDLPELRQLGDQESNIIPMVRPITKYAVLVKEPSQIRYHLEKAWHLCQAGRPGPCWLDIPIDIQSSFIDPAELPAYNPEEDTPPVDRAHIRTQAAEALRRLQTAQRPVILAGSGIRHAKSLEIFQRVIRKLSIPVTTAWTHDLIASDDPLFCGRPGTIGTRAGNFTVQNADVLLILGSRLNIRQTGYTWKSFARAAYKIWVDIDPAELAKPTIQAEMPVLSDLAVFLREIEAEIESIGWNPEPFQGWLAWCQERMQRYPVVQPRQREFRGRINPYHFIDTLFDELKERDIVASGNATACIVPFQAARLKPGQRLFSNSGSASMGYDLPAAIGASVAGPGQRVICLAGDGSLQLNLQELQTVAHYQLPIKLFVLNNGGYLSIRTSQKNFFGSTVGESPASGITFPDIIKVAQAYGLPAWRIDSPDFVPAIRAALETPGPVVCDVVLDSEQSFEPRQSSRQLPDGRIVSAPLEDMYPFLERDELLESLLIPPWQE